MARTIDDDLEEDPEGLGASLTGIPASMLGMAKQGLSSLMPEGKMDDTTKAGLVGFAVRMLTPSWGGIGAQLGGAIGAGAESAAGQEAYQQGIKEKEADRQNKRDVAAMSAASREEIQRMRDETTRAITTEKIAGALERQALRSGPKNMDEMSWLLKEKTRLGTVLAKQIKEMGLDKDAAENWIHMKAEENLAKARASTGKVGGGMSKLGSAESETPEGAAPSTAPKKGAKTPPAAGTPEAAAPAAPKSLERLKKGSDFDTYFADPANRKKMLEQGYSRDEIRKEELARGLPRAGSGIGEMFTPDPNDPISTWLRGLFKKPPPGVVEEGREHIR